MTLRLWPNGLRGRHKYGATSRSQYAARQWLNDNAPDSKLYAPVRANWGTVIFYFYSILLLTSLLFELYRKAQDACRECRMSWVRIPPWAKFVVHILLYLERNSKDLTTFNILFLLNYCKIVKWFSCVLIAIQLTSI